MAYTTIDDPSAFFQTKLWTGTDNSSQAFTLDGNSDLQPDFVWIKNRGYANKHVLFDSVRGVNKSLTSSTDAAEVDQNADGGYLSAFNSDGFTLTEGSGSDNDTNDNRYTYVAWNWKAGTAVSGNTSGSGTAKAYSGSVNTDAGFSIITYIGNGTGGHAIPHHLGVAPKMIIAKNRANTISWPVYHHDIGNERFIYLDTTGASGDETTWNDTTPTSSVFTMASTDNNNNAEANIAYCFAEKQGYSKIGSYVGNGNAANNTFVYTGFKVGWVLIKRSNSAGEGWFIFDSIRSPANLNVNELRADVNTAETTGSHYIDFLSNGFKPKTAGAGIGRSGDTYIYMAFASNPFVTSTGVPATAR